LSNAPQQGEGEKAVRLYLFGIIIAIGFAPDARQGGALPDATMTRAYEGF
jgi:hypothetical protein